ncbi:universal stress protein [Tomitella biformata]|uniref:universal stress protein n=1 Tax=Tomitella biformata TaxID=630403 RepID=UPI0004661B52|nr:universal stress protein [Tomitella biformata]
MSAYNTIVVGTDGSESSLKAVQRAAAIAGDTAKLIIACAYFPSDSREVSAASDQLGEDAYQVHGAAPTYEILRTANEHARAAGATKVEERSIVGPPVESLLQLVDDASADLLVIGNRGLNTITGRLLGSVPSDAARKAKVDVLIVHTVR